jgi:hypothetical protein
MTGGYIAAGTLANLDSKGLGPGGVLAGKSVIYERETFLEWLQRRIERDAKNEIRNNLVRA